MFPLEVRVKVLPVEELARGLHIAVPAFVRSQWFKLTLPGMLVKHHFILEHLFAAVLRVRARYLLRGALLVLEDGLLDPVDGLL